MPMIRPTGGFIPSPVSHPGLDLNPSDLAGEAIQLFYQGQDRARAEEERQAGQDAAGALFEQAAETYAPESTVQPGFEGPQSPEALEYEQELEAMRPVLDKMKPAAAMVAVKAWAQRQQEQQYLGQVESVLQQIRHVSSMMEADGALDPEQAKMLEARAAIDPVGTLDEVQGIIQEHGRQQAELAQNELGMNNIQGMIASLTPVDGRMPTPQEAGRLAELAGAMASMQMFSPTDNDKFNAEHRQDIMDRAYSAWSGRPTGSVAEKAYSTRDKIDLFSELSRVAQQYRETTDMTPEQAMAQARADYAAATGGGAAPAPAPATPGQIRQSGGGAATTQAESSAKVDSFAGRVAETFEGTGLDAPETKDDLAVMVKDFLISDHGFTEENVDTAPPGLLQLIAIRIMDKTKELEEKRGWEQVEKEFESDPKQLEKMRKAGTPEDSLKRLNKAGG